MNKMSDTMTDKEVFKMVFNRIQEHRHRLSMHGYIVCYDGEEKFNIDGHDLAYNFYQLTKLMNDMGEFL